MQQKTCLVVDACMKNSVIGHFQLQVLSQMVNPGRGDIGCLAGKMRQTICLAVDLFIGNSVTGHIQLGF